MQTHLHTLVILWCCYLVGELQVDHHIDTVNIATVWHTILVIMYQV